MQTIFAAVSVARNRARNRERARPARATRQPSCRLYRWREFLTACLVSLVPLCAFAQFQFTVRGFEVSGDNPLDQSTTQKILAPFLGVHENLEGLEDAREALAAELRQRGYMFHRVYVPQQPLGGTVEFVIAPFSIDSISVSGNEHFSEENILRSLPILAPGSTPNTKRLSRMIETVNRNPVKNLDLEFAAGDSPDRMKVRVNVRDTDASRFFLAGNNTGSDQTGEERISLGYQNANVLDKDHIFTATYATSPRFPDDIVQLGAFYQMPLYARAGILNFLAAYSDTDSGTVAGVFDVRGRGTVLGATYTRLFPRIRDLSHWLEFGVVDKGFDNDIEFEDQPLGVDVRSTPLFVRYVGEREKTRSLLTYYVGVAANTGIGSDNDPDSYQATRDGADDQWSVLYAGGSYERRIGGFGVTVTGDVQYAGEALIPGEQFGLGGVTNGVRGFEEREVAGDNGARFSAELWLPRHDATQTEVLFFVDIGHVDREITQMGERTSETLASAGVGFRWNISNKFNAELDFAYVLNGAGADIPDATRDGDGRVHFNFIYQF